MSNLHSEMPDDQIHVAKGHAGATNGFSMWKDERGLQSWDSRNTLPAVLNLVPSNVAPPTEVDGAIYLIGNERGILTVSVIAWQSANTIRYTFSGTPDLTAYVVGDYINVKSATKALNNGSFVITAKNNGAYWIEITNIFREDNTDDETTGAFVTSTLSNWDGCIQNSWARFNAIAGTWACVEAVESVQAYNKDAKEYLFFNGTAWENISERIYKFKVIIPSADVLTSNGTPVLLIDEPADGFIEVLSAIAETDFNTTPYDTNTDLEIFTDDSSSGQWQLPVGLEMPDSSAYKFKAIDGNASFGSGGQFVPLKGVYLKTNTGNPANGDSDIIIYGTYRIVK